MIRRAALTLVALALSTCAALADFTFTLGSGATAFSFTSTTGGTSTCAAASTHCFASVPISPAGSAWFTSGNPGLVNPGTPANWAVGATGSAVPANAILNGISVGGNLTAVSSANPMPVSSGVGQGSTTPGQSVSPVGCRSLTSAASDTTAQTNMPWCRLSGALAGDNYSWGGVALGAPSNYGTSPGAVTVPGFNAFVTNTVTTNPQAGTSGGATPSGLIAANSNNSTNLKASAGSVYGVQTGNINATTAYWLKLYDKASAPTCGSDTPVKRILIPPGNSGNNMNFPVAIKFTLGIGFCIVTGIADNDNTSVPAATIVSNIDWN